MDGTTTKGDPLGIAREVLAAEARAIEALAGRLGDGFVRAVEWIRAATGRVVVTGIGKAGLIGAKVSATLASTGTPSFFLHPSDALHGDLGRVQASDLVLALSSSGESEEVVALIDPLERIGAPLLVLTGRPESRLGRAADLVIDCGRLEEAGPLRLAPTVSTSVLLALGDALAMAVLAERDFGPADFARYHPAGALGRQLLTVGEVMRRGSAVTVVPPHTLARDVVLSMNATPGRPGAAIVVDEGRQLVGFFTDGDLARHLQRGVAFLEQPIEHVMVRTPVTIAPEKLASEALRLLRERRIDQLPVTDADRRPVGLLDVQDLLAARVV